MFIVGGREVRRGPHHKQAARKSASTKLVKRRNVGLQLARGPRRCATNRYYERSEHGQSVVGHASSRRARRRLLY